MLAMEQDRIMIVVRHNNSYGISPDTIQSSGCFGPTCGTNGPQYYITILQGDTIEVIAHEAGIIQICEPNFISDSNTIIVYATIGTACVREGLPLPITFLKPLEAIQKQNSIDLSWSNATQINNEKYIIEHGIDGRTFSLTGEIAGDGTTNETKHYKYIHTSPSIGMNYYRIKQVDYDGMYSYSDIASVRYDGGGKISIYPNPATSEVTITTTAPTSMQIMDVYGKVHSKQEISEGQNTINLAELPKGILIFVVGDQRYRVLKE